MRWLMRDVPVSDLIARMGYEPESYRELYSAPYHMVSQLERTSKNTGSVRR